MSYQCRQKESFKKYWNVNKKNSNIVCCSVILALEARPGTEVGSKGCNNIVYFCETFRHIYGHIFKQKNLTFAGMAI